MSNAAKEIEEIMKRIESQKGVLGTMVLNSEGVPIKSGFDNTATAQYTEMISLLAGKARSAVRDLDPSDNLAFLRIESTNREIMLAPDKEFTLMVVQNPRSQY